MIIFVAKKRYPFQPHLNPLSSLPFIRRIATFSFVSMQSNLHTTATSGTEESGRRKEVFTRIIVWIFWSAGTKKSGRCGEVAVSGGWTVLVTGFPGLVILSFNRIIGGKVFIKEVSFTACHSGKL